ncbi:SVEP1-like protein [Mya arenaria]|uniref:SVEP1-like protein n=1 Tax=Mya arenaria TaxID=6604 RepID=A0ABY7DDB7_MYAAR|nr:SVEP1-like protein [Mya arenaria]
MYLAFKQKQTDSIESQIPCGPGLFYCSTSQSCEACPDDQYQGNYMQTACLSCNSGSYPNAAQTHCQADACFEECLFSDSFATTDCVDAAGGGLECTRTCSDGYVFGNGGTSKTFICSSPNTWDFDKADPTDRYCLPIQNSDDTIDVQVIYNYDFLNHNCFGIVFNKVIGELSTFENNIWASCNQNWDAKVVTVGLVQTAKFSATLKLTLLSSATTTEKNNCLDIIRNNSALFDFGNTNLTCGTVTAAIHVNSTSTGDIEVTCRQSYHFKVTSADLAVDFHAVQVCSTVLRHNLVRPALMTSTKETTCKQHAYYATVVHIQTQLKPIAKLHARQDIHQTMGFIHAHRALLTRTHQIQQHAHSVRTEGRQSECQLPHPCPKGQYSWSGYMNTACRPCPLHHYQATPGMTYCDPCPTSHTTLQTGTVDNTFCLLIEGCNSAYCNDRGTCNTAFGRKNCQCVVGYYGEQCEHILHICNGNPCTNGGSCVRGNWPMEYTCNCVTGFTGDNCEVDNIDNCNNSQCHETSRCVDKVNDYECICSSSGGLGGQ